MSQNEIMINIAFEKNDTTLMEMEGRFNALYEPVGYGENSKVRDNPLFELADFVLTNENLFSSHDKCGLEKYTYENGYDRDSFETMLQEKRG